MEELPAPPPGCRGWPWTEDSEHLPDLMPDGREWPRITVVTPSYSQAQFLEKTIRSVLLQGYPNLEYFVVDGGSADGSVEIVRRYERWITWWVSERDRGQSHAINKGFARAGGEVFAWLNSDDHYLPGALGVIGRRWRAAQKPCVLVGRGNVVDDRDGTCYEKRPGDLSFEVIRRGDGATWVLQPACFFPAEAYRQVGGVDEELHYAMDFDLLLKLRKIVPFEVVDQCVASALFHDLGKTQAQRGRSIAEACFVQIRHGARQEPLDTIEELVRLQIKVIRVLNNPFCRLIMPIVRFLWRDDRRGAATEAKKPR
jgi:glycosyltransferase involved in cell wall biosynthesis